MTLTYPALARADQLLWLVTGADKRDALARLLAGDTSIPAGRVEARRSLVLADDGGRLMSVDVETARSGSPRGRRRGAGRRRHARRARHRHRPWPTCSPALARRAARVRVRRDVAAHRRRGAATLGLRVEPFDALDRLDLAIDGADQIAAGRVAREGRRWRPHAREDRRGVRRATVRRDRRLARSSSSACAPPVPARALAFGLASTLRRSADGRASATRRPAPTAA